MLRKKVNGLSEEMTSILRESIRASQDLAKYLKKHNLDPDKDWTEHPVHGKYVSELVRRTKFGERVGMLVSREKLVKPKVYTRVKKVKGRVPLDYDYPDIDGKPMSDKLKYLYRRKLRKLQKVYMDKETMIRIANNYIANKHSQMVKSDEINPEDYSE